MYNITTYINDLDIKRMLSSQYFYIFLFVILMLYCSTAYQTLPNFMYKLLNSSMFMFIILISIIIIGSQDWYAAVLIAVIFCVVMHNFNQNKIKDEIETYINN